MRAPRCDFTEVMSSDETARSLFFFAFGFLLRRVQSGFPVAMSRIPLAAARVVKNHFGTFIGYQIICERAAHEATDASARLPTCLPICIKWLPSGT
jgi:hypothetical protein